jgi:hypothetical protein
LIARIPAKYRAAGQGKQGTVDSQLINSVDFGPTVLNCAGLAIPDYVQGRAFLGKHLSEPRSYAYGARDRMDERYDIIRSVRDARFRYVRNFEPLKPYYQYMNTPEKGATMQEIRRIQQSGSVPDAVALFTAETKPVEELYDLQSDPFEIKNLATDPAFAAKLAEMREALAKWQNDIGDIGLIPEAEIEIQEKGAGSRYGILHQGADAKRRLSRLVDTATKASLGVSALDDLIEGLSDDDPSVRYWSATGIGNIGSKAARAKPAVSAAMADSSPSVRIAAARAIARLGDADAAIAVLRGELESEHQWGRLAAAIVLDEMDDQAKPAVPALKKAMKGQPNKYIVRVANRAVNDLEGTNHKVP